MSSKVVKIDHVEVMGWQGALRGMRNPKNSWDRSDTTYDLGVRKDGGIMEIVPTIGPNDMKLATSLIAGGPVHRKFLRMIYVTADFTMPIYLTPEFDTYKVATVRDSCSFMHKGVSKEFEIKDFTFEDFDDPDLGVDTQNVRNWMMDLLNHLRQRYLATKDMKYFQAIRQYIPQGHRIRFTWSANYEVLLGMYKWRHNHRLSEWHEICDWICTLPYMNEFLSAAGLINQEPTKEN